jgi:hypothetical protein
MTTTGLADPPVPPAAVPAALPPTRAATPITPTVKSGAARTRLLLEGPIAGRCCVLRPNIRTLRVDARSRRVAERLTVKAAGQLEVLGLTWRRHVWPLATGGAARREPVSTK